MIPLRDNINAPIKPWVNWMFILINGYCFYLELHLHNSVALEKFITHWSVVPSRLWANPAHQWTTLLTATFLHGGWMHIIGNMLFLNIFGKGVEDRMGHVRYFFFYLFIGCAANAAQAYMSPASKLPLLGASGAIAGVLGAYFFYYPYARILTLIPFWIFSRIVEVPAFIFLGVWFLIQALQSVGTLGMKTMQDTGGVAWLAHASGFIAGLLLGPALSLSKKTSKRTQRSTWNK